MTRLSWLHLSDWHQRERDFNRQVVGEQLIEDISERAQAISADLEQLDFIIFSGDVAFSGKAEEYQAAAELLFDPLLKATGVPPERLFIVPGNHDLDQRTFELLPAALHKPFTSEQQVHQWLTDDIRRDRMLGPFRAFSEFVTRYTGQTDPSYANIRRFEVGGRSVALLGVNSALMCGRHREKGEVQDRTYLIVGEPQIHDPLRTIADSDIRIAVIHHPFDWLTDFDALRVERRLGRECDFILRGHQHLPQVSILKGTIGDSVIIPAGATYDRRTAVSPYYVNSYNFVSIDFSHAQGTVFLRRWSDPRTEWIVDEDTFPKGEFRFDLPKRLS